MGHFLLIPAHILNGQCQQHLIKASTAVCLFYCLRTLKFIRHAKENTWNFIIQCKYMYSKGQCSTRSACASKQSGLRAALSASLRNRVTLTYHRTVPLLVAIILDSADKELHRPHTVARDIRRVNDTVYGNQGHTPCRGDRWRITTMAYITDSHRFQRNWATQKC